MVTVTQITTKFNQGSRFILGAFKTVLLGDFMACFSIFGELVSGQTIEQQLGLHIGDNFILGFVGMRFKGCKGGQNFLVGMFPKRIVPVGVFIFNVTIQVGFPVKGNGSIARG